MGGQFSLRAGWSGWAAPRVARGGRLVASRLLGAEGGMWGAACLDVWANVRERDPGCACAGRKFSPSPSPVSPCELRYFEKAQQRRGPACLLCEALICCVVCMFISFLFLFVVYYATLLAWHGTKWREPRSTACACCWRVEGSRQPRSCKKDRGPHAVCRQLSEITDCAVRGKTRSCPRFHMRGANLDSDFICVQRSWRGPSALWSGAHAHACVSYPQAVL